MLLISLIQPEPILEHLNTSTTANDGTDGLHNFYFTDQEIKENQDGKHMITEVMIH